MIQAVHNTSTFEEFSDATTRFTRQVYACPNLYAPLKIYRHGPQHPDLDARAGPSAACSRSNARWTSWPTRSRSTLELRLINYAEVDPSGRPFRARRCGVLRQRGEVRVEGPQVRAALDARRAVAGRLGMATGVWGAFQRTATARITLRVDGTAHVTSATSDIGPGTYTVMTMIAAEYLGLRPEQVVRARRHAFPRAIAGWLRRRRASARRARRGIGRRRETLCRSRTGKRTRRCRAAVSDVEMLDGRLRLKSDPSRFVSVSEVMRLRGLTEIIETFESPLAGAREVCDPGARRAVRRGGWTPTWGPSASRAP
jgi:xanthine dehydrogenase YagR molybdenum-binding subunit